MTNATERGSSRRWSSRAPDAFATIPDGRRRAPGRRCAPLGAGSIADLDADDDGTAGLDRVRRYLFSDDGAAAAASRSTRSSCSRRRAKGASRSRSRAACCARRAAACRSIGWRSRCARRSTTRGLLEHALERAGVPVVFRARHAAAASGRPRVPGARRLRARQPVGAPLRRVPVARPGAGRRDAARAGRRRFRRRATKCSARSPIAPARDAVGRRESRRRRARRRRAARLPRAVEMGAAARRVARRRQRRALGAPAERAGSRVRAPAARAGADRARIGAHRSARRARSTTCGSWRRSRLPIMRLLAAWPAQAPWARVARRFDALAPRVLRRPDRVLRVLADLRPMGAIGPVTLDEAARVLADRLASIEAEPPARRYGRVLVASPAQLRGRTFDVVFVPALAERMFPQKPREDPLLLDDARARARRGADDADRARRAREAAAAAGRRRRRVAAVRVVPDRRRSARAARACRRCTRSKSGAR